MARKAATRGQAPKRPKPAASRIRPEIGAIALSAFAVLILLGSIHLGWHYALDGYVGAAGAALVWHLVGRLLGSQAAAPVVRLATAPCMGKEGLTS